MIDPEAEIAAAISTEGRVGVMATPATIEGGAYRRALSAQGRGLQVTEVAAPDLAPIIQSGFPFDESVVETVRSYCAPLKEAEVDTLILGCTHYPLVAPMLQRMLGRDVRLVTAGHAIAAEAQRILERDGLESEDADEGTYRFLCTGEVESFRELGTRFLQMPLGEIEKVDGARMTGVWQAVLYLHLLAMAYFVGGQLVIASALVPVERAQPRPRAACGRLRASSAIGSAVALVVLLATGSAMASHLHLWGSGTLHLKLGLFAALLALTALHLPCPRSHALEGAVFVLTLAVVWLGLDLAA